MDDMSPGSMNAAARQRREPVGAAAVVIARVADRRAARRVAGARPARGPARVRRGGGAGPALRLARGRRAVRHCGRRHRPRLEEPLTGAFAACYTPLGMNVHSVNKRLTPAVALGLPVGRRRRGRPITDDKRRLILDAALRTFADRGYDGTNVPEIARAAGVGTGSVYRYFADKEALVNEVFRDAKLRLRSALLDGMPAPEPDDLDAAEAWFHELWRRLGRFAAAEPEARAP